MLSVLQVISLSPRSFVLPVHRLDSNKRSSINEATIGMDIKYFCVPLKPPIPIGTEMYVGLLRWQ